MNVLILSFGGDCGAGQEAVARLRAAGHATHLQQLPGGWQGGLALRGALALEGWLLARKSSTATVEPPPGFVADLVVDLTGEAAHRDKPLLTIEMNGHRNLYKGLASIKTRARRAKIVARLNGRPIARALPMISEQTLLSHNRDELLAGIDALIVHTVARIAAGRAEDFAVSGPEKPVPLPCFTCRYLAGIAGGVARKVLDRLNPTQRPFYWRTAWRFSGGPGIAETLQMDGTPLTVLPDDGKRFYADPFPFEHDGRYYLFLEEFPYSEGKGVISVAEMDEEGDFSTPREVLRERHHLSYPNVFSWDEQVFMLPESGDARELVLYRAGRFPDRWVRHAVLMEGRSINDATLIEREGRWWMFATERFGAGSASDTMVVFSAIDLSGPWLPHRLNPIVIDKAGARPGGRIIAREGRLFLPVQDGSETYGGALGLREIVQLDDENVELGPVLPISGGAAWNVRGIHTLNRAGCLETVDSTW